MVCLKAAIKRGGKVLTPMLIAKKVVPQKIETAAKASQGNKSEFCFKIKCLFAKVRGGHLCIAKYLQL